MGIDCCKETKPRSQNKSQNNNSIGNLNKDIRKNNIINNISFDKYYITGTLQCLLYTLQLTKFFRNEYKENKTKELSDKYYNIVRNLWNQKEPFSSQNFKSLIFNFYNLLEKNNIKNDSKEVIEFLFEKMHKELNNINDYEIISEEINDNSDKDEVFNLFFNNFKKTNNSIISNLFYGIYEIKYQCNICRETNYDYECFSFIELNLEKKVPLRFQKQDNWPMEININLIDCFDFNKNDHYVTEEKKANCSCGNKLKKYSKYLFSMPNYLIIFLKRIDKNIYKINYPEKLDLTNYLIHNEYGQIFNLYAAIPLNNLGYNKNNVISYCKYPNNKKWYKYNENTVIECEENEFLEEDPYVLFYELAKD